MITPYNRKNAHFYFYSGSFVLQQHLIPYHNWVLEKIIAKIKQSYVYVIDINIHKDFFLEMHIFFVKSQTITH